MSKTKFEFLNNPIFKKANLKEVSIENISVGDFSWAILESVNFKKIFNDERISEQSLNNFDIYFNDAHLTKVSFNSIQLKGNQINFSRAKLNDITFKSLDLTEANVHFIDTEFKDVVFDDIKFKDNTIFIDNNFVNVIFRNCDLSQVELNLKDNHDTNIILDKVKLNVFQLVNFYKAGIRDFSTVELKDISDDLIPQSELLPLAHLSTEEKIKTFLSRHKLPGIKLSEQMFEYLISHDFRNFKATDLQLISHETLAKYVIQPDYQFEDANFPDNFSFYNSACSGMQARTKRSLKKFCSRLREMKDDSNTHLIQENEKIIDDMSFLNAQQAWQQNIASILEDLEGNWYPKLMAVKPLKNGNEEVLFINVDTQEERVYELPGRTSITLLERLRSIYQSSFLNRLNEKTQFLEHLAKNINFDPSQFVEPNVSKGDVFETEIGDGSFMLFVALSTKSTIDLIKNNGCPVGTTTAEIECYFNVAFSIQMLTSTGFFVGSLAWQKTLFPNLTKLLSKLALPLMFFQEGFDIYKLGTAKNETGIAQAATALTFDTAMLGLTIAAALGSEIAGPLIVPLVGLSIGIGSLVQNYEALLSSEKAVGKLFNQMNIENKQGGFIRELFTNSSSEYYIQALPTVVIKEIDFNSKRIEFSSAMVRRSITESFTRCPAADPNEHNVFNLRAALGYAETIQLMYPETLTWVLPSMPQFSISYNYRQAPFIELRHDAEFDTLRELESLESFYAYKYCLPTTYAITEIFVKYTQHTLYVNLDRESRNLVIPEAKYPQYIHNIIDANTLNDASCTLYLNAGSGSILLRGGRKQYRWVFNAMSLKRGHVNFSKNSIDIAGVNITLERPQQRYYFLITHEGHTFILDREQQRKILSVINYTQLQNDTQTIQSFITSQAHVQETLSIINYNNSLNYYTGPAFYLTKENSIFFTRDISQDLVQDAVLISVSKNSALFFNERLSQLWRTNRHDYKSEANYVFPGKIISISQVENGLQILVKHENENYLIIYQLVDIDQPPILQSVEILNYSPFGIIEDISWSCDSFISNHNPQKKIDDLLIDLQIIGKTDKDREFIIRSKLDKWIKLVSQTPFIQPIRTRLSIPPIRSRLPIPSIPPIEPIPREITWKKIVTWLESSVENNSFTYRAICPNSTINFLGPVLGTIFETNQTLAYFIDKENHQKQGIFLQKIYQEDQFISFKNRPPLYFNYNFKKIFYNKGKPILLMPDDVLNELDSTGNIQIVGFTATWTQRYTTWWKEIFHYLADKKVANNLIVIQGIKDQQGKALTVLYDPHATCYVLIKENVLNQSLNYRGKIAVDTGYYYYFYLAEKGIIYQYQGITIEKMEDLFQGHKLQKEVPMLEKIAVYQPYYPPGIPTSELTEILNVVPQVLVTSHVWLQTSQGLSLFFDANTQSWQLQRIDYEKWFGRLDSYKFYELNYRVNRLAIDLQLKALTKNEVLLITENHKIKFWVVGNNQVVAPPIQNDIYNWFYLGKSVSDPETYFFFSAYEKKIYFLGSTVACDNDYDYYSDIDITIKSSVKKTMKVNFVDKMDEHSLVLGLNPHEVDGNTIPKLENIESLGLLLSSDSSFTFSLANRTTPFYSRLIYQVSDHKTMSTLELPDNGPWMANKIKNVMNDTVNSGVLVIFNEDQQLSFPLYSENNIFIQVNRGYGAEKKIYRKSLQEINQRVEKSVEPIFIFNAWNVAHVSSFNDSLKTNPGHYQQEMLEMNVPAQLSQTNSESNRIGLSIKDWSAWLGGGLAFVGLGVGGYCAWLFRRRAGHAGYNGAKVVSIGAGSMVLEFNGAHATEYSEERVEQEKVGSNPSLAIGETLQSATIPEMTVNNLEYFAGSFWGNTLLPFASLFSEKMSRQREEKYRKLDLEHKIIIRQLEEQLADIERRNSEASETIEVSSTSPKKEWSNNQKATFMRIIPVITQTEDQFIESLQIKSANTNSKRGVCDFIQSGCSFFKSIANTYRFPTKVLQTIFPQS